MATSTRGSTFLFTLDCTEFRVHRVYSSQDTRLISLESDDNVVQPALLCVAALSGDVVLCLLAAH